VARRRALASTTPPMVIAPPTRINAFGTSCSHSQPISSSIGGYR
jgi:hypothetical protein